MKHLQRVKRSGVISPSNPEVVAAESLLRKNKSDLAFIDEQAGINEDVSEESDDYDNEDNDNIAVTSPKRPTPEDNLPVDLTYKKVNCRK